MPKAHRRALGATVGSVFHSAIVDDASYAPSNEILFAFALVRVGQRHDVSPTADRSETVPNSEGQSNSLPFQIFNNAMTVAIRLDDNEWPAILQSLRTESKNYRKIGNRDYAKWLQTIIAKIESQRINADFSAAPARGRSTKR
jgi:hypothetical protein